MYKDKLQNCSCNQFHYIGTYKQVEKNSMIKKSGGFYVGLQGQHHNKQCH